MSSPVFSSLECEEMGDDLDDFVVDVTIIAQTRCEHTTDFADVETLICDLPLTHLTFATHDCLAPYRPYPMALLVRAFIVKAINGWDETALHGHRRANPSFRQDLGFETVSNQ